MSDFLTLPLKYKIATTVVDFYGSMSYALSNKHPLIPYINKWMSDNADYYGSFTIYDSLHESVKDYIQCNRLFSVKEIQSIIEETQMLLKKDRLSDVINEYRENEDCYLTGKSIRSYIVSCSLKRSIKTIGYTP